MVCVQTIVPSEESTYREFVMEAGLSSWSSVISWTDRGCFPLTPIFQLRFGFV